jgi:2-aminoadipate transaminase
MDGSGLGLWHLRCLKDWIRYRGNTGSDSQTFLFYFAMTLSQPVQHRLSDLFAQRAQIYAAPSFGSEIPGPVPLLTSFAFGLADPSLFPTQALAAASEAVLIETGADVLNYGSTHEALIEQVLQIMAERGVTATAEQVVISHGSGQLLALLPHVFVEPGDVVLVEGPTFMGAVGRFAAAGARLLSIPVDEAGMDVEILEHHLRGLARQGIRPRFIYTIPTFHNPKGSCLSLERRSRLVALAAHYGVVVVEDDAYYDLRFEGDPLPTLAELDQEGWVLHIGTFSKIVAPGLRVGWGCGSPELVKRLDMFRTEGSLGRYLGRLVAAFCANGQLKHHIQSLKQGYRHKRDVMMEAIRQYFPDQVRVTLPEGGFFIWVELPGQIDAQAVLTATRAQGVTFLPGSRCYAEPAGDHALRLAFSYQPPERILEGIGVIGSTLKSMLKG